MATVAWTVSTVSTRELQELVYAHLLLEQEAIHYRSALGERFSHPNIGEVVTVESNFGWGFLDSTLQICGCGLGLLPDRAQLAGSISLPNALSVRPPK